MSDERRTKVIVIIPAGWVAKAISAPPGSMRLEEAITAILAKHGAGEFSVVSATYYPALRAGEILARTLDPEIVVHIDSSLGSEPGEALDAAKAWEFILSERTAYVFAVTNAESLSSTLPMDLHGASVVLMKDETAVLMTPPFWEIPLYRN